MLLAWRRRGFRLWLPAPEGAVLSAADAVFGFVPMAASALALQIVVATSGTIGNLYGSVNFTTAAWVTVFALLGVAVGARLRPSPVVQRRMAAGLCIVLGIFMLMRTL